MRDALCSFIAGGRDRMIELQRDLVAIPALGPVNGGQGEREKAEYLCAWCDPWVFDGSRRFRLRTIQWPAASGPIWPR